MSDYPQKSTSLKKRPEPFPSKPIYPSNPTIKTSSLLNPNRLNSYKGKFSLTTRYSSNNPNSKISQYQSHNHQQYSGSHHQKSQLLQTFKNQYESNKENMGSRGNLFVDSKNHQQKYDPRSVDKNKKIPDQFVRRPSLNKFPQEKIDTSRIEQDAIRIIKQAAGNINFAQKQQNIHQKVTKQLKNQKSFDNKHNQNKSFEKKTVIKIEERRSKVHKYDHLVDHNQFLVMDDDVGQYESLFEEFATKEREDNKNTNESTINKNNPATTPMTGNKNRKTNTSKDDLQKVTQEQKLQIMKQSQNLKAAEQKIIQYEQTIKEVSFSLIKLISIIGKCQEPINKNQTKAKHKEEKVREWLELMKEEVCGIYRKQLVKYIDKMGIREKIVNMAARQSVDGNEHLRQYEQSSYYESDSLKTQQILENNLSRKQSGIYHDKSNQQTQHHIRQEEFNQSSDSILQQYEINEEYSANYLISHNSQSIDSRRFKQTEHEFENADTFYFHRIDDLAIMGSGKNLLETFNNQNLANELALVSEEDQKLNLKQSSFRKHNESHTHECNLNINPQKTLNQISEFELQLNNDDENMSLCRKLFHFQHPLIDLQQPLTNNLQHAVTTINIEHHPATTNQQQSNAKQQSSRFCLSPEHYYRITRKIKQQTSSNYLILQTNDKIKLLRKVDHQRWIAEHDDKIGFVEEIKIIGHLKMLEPSTEKKALMIR